MTQFWNIKFYGNSLTLENFCIQPGL
jgi:hypothetical protein